MKCRLFLLLIVCAVASGLYGCAPVGATRPTPTAGAITAVAELTLPPTSTAVTVSPATSPERTPDPASEMLVTGTVTVVAGNTIQVKSDSLGRDIVVTMLDRSVFAPGVSKVFKVGNYVRVITSSALAKTLPERAAARMILENNSQS